MLDASQVVYVRLTRQEVALCHRYADLACIGGVSAVRDGDRRARLGEDQLVGLLGHLAFCKVWFGTAQPFLQARWVANQRHTEGDCGSDVIGALLDVKTSLMRASRDPLRYHLWVREREYKPEAVYVLALVPELPVSDAPCEVSVVGWVKGAELTRTEDTDRWEIGAEWLHPVPPVRWSW